MFKPIIKKGKCERCGVKGEVTPLGSQKRCFRCYILETHDYLVGLKKDYEEMMKITKGTDEFIRSNSKDLQEKLIIASQKIFGRDHVSN